MPCYQHMKTQPPPKEHWSWKNSRSGSPLYQTQMLGFHKEDITAGGVQISLGLISGEYVFLQIHTDTDLHWKDSRSLKQKVLIVRKSKNSCSDIERFLCLQHYIMPFCHYTTPGISFIPSGEKPQYELSQIEDYTFSRIYTVYSSMWM